MGCGVSKDCIADPSSTKSKKKLIHACKEHLQSAVAEISCTHIASAARPSHQYIHPGGTPSTLEEQGDAELAAEVEEEEEEENNEPHVHVRVDDDNAEEVITINHDELEYLENKPPITQPLQTYGCAHTHANSHANVLPALPCSHKPSPKSPLRELSISSNGKLLDARKDHLRPIAIHTSSPRSSNHFYSGISPSCPGLKPKSNSCPVKLLSPFPAWNSQNPQSPNFIKTFADHQLSKEVENIDYDAALEDQLTNAVTGRPCNPAAAKTGAVHKGNQSEELSKSNAEAIMDGFIEDLQQEALESNQLSGRLTAFGNLSSSPNSYMRELLEHFDKSTEPLYMPTTPRTATWQSKLLETINRDIDNMQAELSKDQGSSFEHHHIDHTRYESIEL